MKIIKEFLNWITPIIIVGIAFVGLLWEDNLSIPSFDHTIFAFGILVALGLILNSWLSNHEVNTIVSAMNEHTRELEKKK
ncbi:MAG TPA: hypothetical protein VN376_01650 [Longilinea sp.]|nr:hypothetical protein [Longilinea sp.]